ncbi:MAG: MogA/MoaB family molybdenum cofactor biosynthesis protein [Candidatus Acidiferrales bacterium]
MQPSPKVNPAQHLRVAVLTVSDSVSAGTTEDRSGPAVIAHCTHLGWIIAHSDVIADDRSRIENFLKTTADAGEVDLILTTGGTGVSPRDVTPEATLAVCERLVPGFAEQMRAEGLKKNHRATLSRAAAGIRGKTFIINLPGSPRGAVESLEAIAYLLPHAVSVLHGARHD